MKGAHAMFKTILGRCDLSNRYPKVFTCNSKVSREVYEFYVQFHTPILAFTEPIRIQLRDEGDNQ